MLSETYKDIYICNDGRYIVKDKDNYLRIIDNEYNNVFDKKYAVINPRLISKDLYLVLDSTENIKFNDYGLANFNWSIMNNNGEIILDGIEQIYDQIYELPKDKKSNNENYTTFENELKKLDYKFVGDKFYSEYK